MIPPNELIYKTESRSLLLKDQTGEILGHFRVPLRGKTVWFSFHKVFCESGKVPHMTKNMQMLLLQHMSQQTPLMHPLPWTRQ